jgi:outer membrane protein TolC
MHWPYVAIRSISPLFVISILLLAPPLSSVAAESLAVSRHQAVSMALANNLELKVEGYNPAIAATEVGKSKGIYDPRFSLLADYTDSSTLSSNTIFTGGVTTNKTQTLRANPGITQLLPTGGTLALTFDNTQEENNSTSSFVLNRYWQSQLSLGFKQPLLKNFGPKVTEVAITTSELQQQGAVEQLRSKVIDIVARVRTEYVSLYGLAQELEARRVSVELAYRILSETEGRVRAGVLPAMEILNAQFGVATREQELMDAYRAWQDGMDRLRILIDADQGKEIVPVDPPTRELIATDEEKALAAALALRPDIAVLKKRLEVDELQVRVTRNRKLPDLTLNGSYAVTGLGERYRQDTDRLSSADYPVWSAGISFSYPLGNREASNDASRAALLLEQDRTQLLNLQKSVANEVRSALRGAEISYKQLEVTDRGRAFAEERLRAYIRKNEVGLATTREVLDVENDLALARSNQIQASVAYQAALTKLWQATGELLPREGILFRDGTPVAGEPEVAEPQPTMPPPTLDELPQPSPELPQQEPAAP